MVPDCSLQRSVKYSEFFSPAGTKPFTVGSVVDRRLQRSVPKTDNAVFTWCKLQLSLLEFSLTLYWEIFPVQPLVIFVSDFYEGGFSPSIITRKCNTSCKKKYHAKTQPFAVRMVVDCIL